MIFGHRFIAKMEAIEQKDKKMDFERLIENLKSESGLQRARSAELLGKLANKRASKYLIAALNDENMRVRSNAAFALVELRARKALSFLVHLLAEDIQYGVRKSAAKALGILRSRNAV